jgi:glyoxylase-like metal-dependent hydrolase (beta-lactamase superfamily II)
MKECLSRLGLTLRAEDFLDAGRWITPPSFPSRFDARVFLVEVPADAPAPEPDPHELSLAQWISPARGLAEWTSGRSLLHAPVLNALEVLLGEPRPKEAAAHMAAPPYAVGHVSARLEYQKGVRAVALLTPTLPPAAHTNCYVLGNGELLIVDPGADDTRESARLFALLEGLKSQGLRPVAVLLTHHHADHVGGALRVKERLKLPLFCHAHTAEHLGFVPERLLEDGQVLTLSGAPPQRWRVLHTPGHARGHLCLLEETSHALVAGDMVAGLGTVLIDPPEGDMIDYLSQLRRLKDLPVGVLYPAHGPPIPGGPNKLEEYLEHREKREQLVLAALKAGNAALPRIAEAAYPELPTVAAPLAERSTHAILLKLVREGRVVGTPDGFVLAEVAS